MKISKYQIKIVKYMYSNLKLQYLSRLYIKKIEC